MIRDTTPDAAAVRQAIYRRMTPDERVRAGIQMSIASRRIVVDGIRHRHPAYSDAEARFAMLRLVLGDDLFRRAYPHAPVLAP